MEMFGSSWSVFIGLTVILFGFAAFMTGNAIAETWRPGWQIVPYSFLLGAADRFLVYALFGGELLSPAGYILDTLVLLVIATASYRMTRAHKMVSQYPWIYERSGLFAWKEKV